MKKSCILLGAICAIITSSYVHAQTVREGEIAVVYYMPQTQLQIDIEYEEIILHRGIYADYAKQYLGTTDVVTEDGIQYKLTAVKPHIKTVADYSRAHKVLAANGVHNQLLTLTEQGTLWAFNCKLEDKEHNNNHSLSCPQKTKQEENNILPLFEEHIVGKSLAQQAQGAAKLIFRLRENRIYLIGGEVDKAPSDGVAMKLALEELDQLEKQLVALFIGRIEVVKRTETITYTPMKSEERELAFFSETSGITTAENGDPILLHLTARRQSKGMSNMESGNKSPIPSQICYNLPGSATYRITYLNQVVASDDIQVAQFGVAIPLAQELFKGKNLPQIRFNPQTGNIHSIHLLSYSFEKIYI